MPERAFILTEPIAQAEWTIAVIVRNGRSRAAEYIGSLSAPDSKRLTGLLRRMAQAGPPANLQENRKLDDDIWELKSLQQRLLYFTDGPRRIVITHGFTKKQQKTPPAEIARARRMLVEYQQSNGGE